jgi:hypothetical protein
MTALSLEPHWALYPRSYVVLRAPYSFQHQIDGDLNKSVWQKAPWSEPFGDIQGSDAPSSSLPPAETRFKALYDDTHLYIGALLHPSEFFPTEAHFTQRNDPIYQKDSDMEVFVDAPGCHHFYKEFEVNALNTVWNLMLNKPYNDGGEEYSGRVARPGEPNYYEVYHQSTAVQIIQGRANDPTGKGALWSVEMAFSYRDLLAHMPIPVILPQPGHLWRINFSRVERQGQVNWTWQPQRVWDASVGKHRGQINMHLPDAYGYFVFGDNDPEHSSDYLQTRDMSWPLRLAVMNVYYAQHHYKELHGRFSEDLKALDKFLDQCIVSPFEISISTGSDNTFLVKATDGSLKASVTDDRYMLIEAIEDAIESV